MDAHVEAELALRALRPTDRLSLLIGRAARQDVALEFTLQSLWTNLAGFGYATFLVPADLSQLVEQCTIMFKAHPFEGRYRSAGLGALVAAKAVHQERNRVVHDMWIPSIGPDRTVVDPETFARQRLRRKDDFGKVEMKTLDDVAEVVEQLERAQFRISSLVFSPPLFPAGGRGEPTEEDLRMIEGRFDLEDGGARTHTD